MRGELCSGDNSIPIFRARVSLFDSSECKLQVLVAIRQNPGDLAVGAFGPMSASPRIWLVELASEARLHGTAE